MPRLLALAVAVPLAACAHPRAPSGLDEPGLIALRRQIHQNPELAGQERETAALIAEKMRQLGLEVRTGVGGHGVVAVLRGARPGPIIAYRAEFDAVAETERAQVPFRSRRPGAAHICGHDVAVAVAVGIAEILAAGRADMNGTLKLIFQPGEENLSGARAMIAAGALGDPEPREIYAVHSAPLPVGTLGYGPGLGYPGLDTFDLVLPNGTNADDAKQLAERIDALSTVQPPRDGASWQVLMAQLQAQPSPLADFLWVRTAVKAPPTPPTVRAFVRTAHDEAYEATRARILALAPPATQVVHREPPFPGVSSDTELSAAAVAPLASVLGTSHLIRMGAAMPFSGDDFALYVRQVRGALFWLGVADVEHGINGQPHSADFQADERAIAVGARAMAALLRARLAHP